MPWIVSQIRVWPISEIRPLGRNPHVHDPEQMETMVRLVRHYGFLYPLLVHRKEKRLIDGHLRLEAAQRLGMKKLPVIEVDHLDPASIRALVVAVNQITHRSTFDDEIVADYLREMKQANMDLALSAFTDEMINEILAGASTGVVDDEEKPVGPLPKHPVTRAGDLWCLDGHRVMCGDALNTEHVMCVLEGRPADVVWTDPPYGVGYEAAAGGIQNDDLPQDALEQFLAAALTGAAVNMKPGSPIYVSHADTSGLAFRKAFLHAGFKLSSCLIWRKNSLVLSRGDYHWQHEPILYGWKPGAAHRWYGGRDKTTIAEFDAPPFVQVGDDEWHIAVGETTLLVRGEKLTVEAVHGTIFLEEKPASNPHHPTMKPVALVQRMLANSARAGAHVLDMFAGSGSTLIACERLRMVGHMLDIEPRYVDVVLERWQNYTGKEARLGASDKSFEQIAHERRGS